MMYENERLEKILSLLEANDFLTVNELEKYIDASPATIRRDIIKLSEMNLLSKVHGGIKPGTSMPSVSSPSFSASVSTEKIAAAAVSQIKDHDCIYISCGPYTIPVIRAITQENITIVTDHIPDVYAFHRPNINLFFLEGDIDLNTRTIQFSEEALNKLHHMNFTRIFLGAEGVDKSAGFSTSQSYDHYIKTILMKCPAEHYVVTDHQAFGRHFFFSFAGLKEAVIITDSIPGDYRTLVNLQT